MYEMIVPGNRKQTQDTSKDYCKMNPEVLEDISPLR